MLLPDLCSPPLRLRLSRMPYETGRCLDTDLESVSVTSPTTSLQWTVLRLPWVGRLYHRSSPSVCLTLEPTFDFPQLSIDHFGDGEGIFKTRHWINDT